MPVSAPSTSAISRISPRFAVAAAAIGSLLADILAGYAIYAPGTLVIKGLVALVAALIWQRFSANRVRKTALTVRLTAAIAAELVMVLGYFLYESLILGYGMGALPAVPANLGQAAVGVIIAMIFTPALHRSREITEMLDKFRK